MKKSKMKKLLQGFNSIFEYKDQPKYNFTIPENPNENKDISYEKEISEQKSPNEPKNIFSSLNVNLEFIKNKYNTSINSDISIREFSLTARNKQHNAFLLYIDGMVDAQLINDFVLEPLMLKNRANSFDGDEDVVVKEALTSNISVRKVKKFNLVDYIYNNLMPQNNVKKVQEFEKIISGVNSRKLCFVC